MEAPNVDKRTKEYKQWKEKYDNDTSKGLGDIVETITEKTGIKKLVKFVAGEDCGCDKRKEKLNKVRFRFPVVRCFTEDQYNAWSDFRELKTNTISHKQQVEILIPIYAQLFARQLKPLSCCAEPYIKEIDRIFELYSE